MPPIMQYLASNISFKGSFWQTAFWWQWGSLHGQVPGFSGSGVWAWQGVGGGPGSGARTRITATTSTNTPTHSSSGKDRHRTWEPNRSFLWNQNHNIQIKCVCVCVYKTITFSPFPCLQWQTNSARFLIYPQFQSSPDQSIRAIKVVLRIRTTVSHCVNTIVIEPF